MMDAICAIATPYGAGAISIVRASGKDCIKMINEIFKGPDLTKVASHTISYGSIVYEGEVLDEVLVSVFLPPRTYTKEECVEHELMSKSQVAVAIIDFILTKMIMPI